MANQIIQTEIHYIVNGQLAINVLHWFGDSSESDLFLVARHAVDALDGTFAGAGIVLADFTEIMSADAFISAVVVRVVGVAPGPKYVRVYPASTWEGEAPDNCYSQTVAANIKLITASGPDFTGRIFLPAVSEGFIETNRYTSAAEAEYATFRSRLAAGLVSDDGTFDLAVYNRTTKTSELVTNTMLVPNPGTIRGRVSPV